MTAADIKFALSITHCPWIEKRVQSMARLRETLAIYAPTVHDPYHEETQRAPWWVWADSQWRWGAAQEHSTHVVYLQDDAKAAPFFWKALHALVAARPNEIISLHCIHLASMTLARQGVRWCSTADGLIGLGYVLPVDVLREFMTWRLEALRPGGAQEFAEDSQLNIFALSTGRRIFHPIPTIIDHDLTITSTNQAQTAGRPRVVWTDGDVGGWTDDDLQRESFWKGEGKHLGRQYAKTHWAAKMIVPGFDKFFEAEMDVCPPEYSRFLVIQ
jgi:hypothetical protein